MRRVVSVEKSASPAGTDGVLVAERMLENGYETVRTSLQCVLTVVKEINDPRLPSLAGVLLARQAKVSRWGAQDLDVNPKQLGLDGSPTRVSRIFPPKPRTGGVMLQGTPDEMIAELVGKLKDVVAG